MRKDPDYQFANYKFCSYVTTDNDSVWNTRNKKWYAMVQSQSRELKNELLKPERP